LLPKKNYTLCIRNIISLYLLQYVICHLFIWLLLFDHTYTFSHAGLVEVDRRFRGRHCLHYGFFPQKSIIFSPSISLYSI